MIVLVTTVGAAAGSKAAAAALACAGADVARAALLIDLGEGKAPRPSLIATAAARELEERVAAHLPQAEVASRGALCQLSLPADPAGVEQVPAVLPIVRDSAAILHLAPHLLQAALEERRIGAMAALLRADLEADRALTALAASDLIERGVRVAVLKHPLGWLSARAALLGALPPSSEALPGGLRSRLLSDADNKFHSCYDRKDELDNEQRQAAPRQVARQEPARPGAREGASQGGRKGLGH